MMRAMLNRFGYFSWCVTMHIHIYKTEKPHNNRWFKKKKKKSLAMENENFFIPLRETRRAMCANYKWSVKQRKYTEIMVEFNYTYVYLVSFDKLANKRSFCAELNLWVDIEIQWKLIFFSIKTIDPRLQSCSSFFSLSSLNKHLQWWMWKE